MVALKKIFQQERPSRPSTSTGFATDDSYLDSVPSPTRSTHLDPSHLYPSPPSPALPSPFLKTGRSLDVSHHFEQIDKQFEDLHQHLGSRPLSSQSSLAPNVPGGPNPARGRFPGPRTSNSRHIDLMEAIGSSEIYRQDNISPPVSPPTSPYNEDVAERNMTRFLRIQHQNGLASSRILSALYQEDVADRNIAKYSGPCRSLSALSSRSSPPAPGRVRNLSPNAPKRKPKKHNWTSDGDLRNRSDGVPVDSRDSTHLRVQRSAPSLSAEDDADEDYEEAPAPVVQRLGIPPAYKQGKRWSNTPLPDSPTLPPPLGDTSNGDNASPPDTPPVLQPPSPTARSSSLTPRSLSPPPSAGTTSRKNVRDLSINTQLASTGRSKKISHRAIQPPTPSTGGMKRAPSIAEVMNSPLPVQTPTSAGPSPRFKVSEMMELFTKAYHSSHALSPHPTYESLQDAIVREINSHDAFKRVPVPAAAGPLFTPSDEGAFEEDSRPYLNHSASAGQFSKIMRKSSFKKHKRNTESSRSISSVPSRSLFRKTSTPSLTRRRHTDAPLPSPGLLADVQKSVPQTPAGVEQLTYMDVLIRASNDTSGSSARNAIPAVTATRSSTPTPNAPGTVYCMQAHSTPSKDSRSSLSGEDSDDDIIHLPSVVAPPPRVQIEGVDENNVRYVIDSATANDAQKLMSWPQRLRRAQTPQPFCENSLSPLSRARMQLRGARSVETY
ncbi:hypothetical protein N7478_004501 [Penicillium angulare]|uniref:uncharacterized protein n=1 Tax=Penicillium angulare TaxID=116970 RepID=UPI002540C308|nr:uncharacterized protein N7478_004501 [Penicillium angulare]KAJ5279129.1 hypothetical protein N7478_004501 [Penicillium angulare]